MNNRDTVIYSNFHEKAIIEHHGKDYGVKAKVICNASSPNNDGDGITTPLETWYEYDFIIDSLEIFDHDGNNLDMSSNDMIKLIDQIQAEIIDFCKENTDKFYN